MKDVHGTLQFRTQQNLVVFVHFKIFAGQKQV
jgi:hypothetical protein